MHLVADSINLIAPYTYNKGVISLGGTSDNIGRLRPAGNHTVANNATLNLVRARICLCAKHQRPAWRALLPAWHDSD